MTNSIRIIKRRWWKEFPTGRIHQFKDGDIVCGDALAFLSNIRDKSADIVFLDPPFNLGKKYGSRAHKHDKMDEATYTTYMTKVILRAVDILRDGGALYLYHLPQWAIIFAGITMERLDFRHWIAISMKNGYPRGNKLYPAHYALLYFTKGTPITFKRPKIPPKKCRHCNQYIKDYGGYKKFIENGINVSDIWDDISPVRHKKYKNRIANELPLDIPNRIADISGKPNGTLIDPFAGTGTSLLAARNHKMKFIACDNELEAFKIMINRLEESS